MRFASHRDIARALERSLRRAGLPVAYSEGFSPHPKISYAGAAPTGVASEAEYLELTLAETCGATLVRERLDGAMPDGLDIVEVVAAAGGGLADRLEASVWRIDLAGVSPDDAATAAAAFLAAESVEVDRLTKKGRRTVDARGPVLDLRVLVPDGEDASAAPDRAEAVLHLVVRNATPSVRPDDVITALGRVSPLAPPSPPRATRLAQGPVDEGTGDIGDPLAPDHLAAVAGGRDTGARTDAGPAGQATAPCRTAAPASAAGTP